MQKQIQIVNFLLSLFAIVFSSIVLLNYQLASNKEGERKTLKEEIYKQIVQEIDEEMRPLYKSLGVKPPSDSKIGSRLRPFLEPLNK